MIASGRSSASFRSKWVRSARPSSVRQGAQKCGQTFGAVSAKMGNGVWTVEIIPAEIQPPARIPAGASGNRIRIGSEPVTNWGDRTNLVVAFNEQVLIARHRLDALEKDALTPHAGGSRP